MANTFTTQILEEGPRNVIMKVTGVLDTSDQALTIAVDVSALNQGGIGPAPEQVRIDSIDYSISDQLAVQLLWDATTDVGILGLTGREDMSFKSIGGLTNNAGAGKTGDILIKTTGYATGTQVFSLVLAMVKQGSDL